MTTTIVGVEPVALSFDELAAEIQRALPKDRAELAKLLQWVRGRSERNEPFDRKLDVLRRQLAEAIAAKEKREQSRPTVKYDPALPITAAKDEIATAIHDRQVVVLCGETGSGKSTQLPKICLEMGRGIDGLIGHTQPRRLAARSVAARIAEELGVATGTTVGFKIRFTDATSPRTLIKLMTDGILLAETQSDPLLSQYDTLIIDEAHERSLNIDFLLGYVKRILPRRPDLRLIITSATIDVERYAEFFADERGPAPIIEVSGRMYPVEVRYAPPELNEDDDGEIDWQRSAADACELLALEGPGDMLVFMPTERDIRETCKVLRGRSFAGDFDNRKTEVVPLYGRLSEAEQNRIFQTHQGRRIVVATNVAESSLTVPGIRFVVDPGTARISRFAPSSKVQRLPIEPISQASADQRKGRCGRVGPGICVRLYSQQDYQGRERFTPPEILRTNLAAVLLQMKSLRLGRIEDFPLLDPPKPGAIRGGLKTLYELGAIDEEENLTPIGKTLAKLPVDPCIGRMILAAADEGCLGEVLIIASALEVRDPRDRPVDKQQQADEAHAKFNDEQSDFISLLKLWQFYDALDDKLSESKLRKACHQNFLSYNRMREWRDLCRQLREIVESSGVVEVTTKEPRTTVSGSNAAPPLAIVRGSDEANRADAVHRAILTGLLANVGSASETHEYNGGGGQTFFIWPGSVAFRKKPKWIMAAELVETTRRFARVVGPIQPEWIERLAAHLVKRTYSEPHWSKKSAGVMAWEKVLLFGLPIIPRRLVRYGPIDPQLSRELFIRRGLVEGDYESRGDFVVHNKMIKEELVAMQAKLRQGSLFHAEDREVEFFEERIPADVHDGPGFEKWRKDAERIQPELLWMTREDLLEADHAAPTKDQFPDTLQIGSMKLPLEYRLDPGMEHDGVTVIVPREGVQQLPAARLEWLVPGLIEEKVAALIKTLPKELRRMFVPVPDTARELAPHLEFGAGHLNEALSQLLRRRSGEHVPADAFDASRLPSYLRMNVRVVDGAGKEIAVGRDLNELQQQISRQSSAVVREVKDARWSREGITGWDFGDLPTRITLDRGGIQVHAFPMLVDAGSSVSLKLGDRAAIAERQTRTAMVRLCLLAERRRIDEQVLHLPKFDQLKMLAATLPGGMPLKEALAWRMAERSLFATNKELPRTADAWQGRLKQVRNHLGVAAQDVTALTEPLLTSYREIRRLLEPAPSAALREVHADLSWQLELLTTPGFFTETPWGWLAQYPRYFQGMLHRWSKLTSGGFQKDQRAMQDLLPWLDRLRLALSWAGSKPHLAAAIEGFRWLIEEYRVSLFAQQLKTAVPVSVKRLEEVWSGIEKA